LTPFPLRLTTCGVLDALSLISRVPVIAPTTVGANFTEIVQLFPVKSADVQVLVWVNPAVVEMLATLSEADPLLLRVTVLTALAVPTARFPKLKLVGLTEPTATGVGVAVGVAVCVAVVVAVPVAVAVDVAVLVAVAVAVLVAVRVVVAVAVVVLVAVVVGVAVLVAVAVAELVAAPVGVDVRVAVAVAVGVGVIVPVGVGEGAPRVLNAITLAE